MKTWVTTVGLVLVLAGTAAAGEIVLKNGSRVSGELTGDVLLVSTGSGVVEVDPADIRVLTPGEIRLKDGRVIRGTLVGQHVKTRTPLGELAVKLDELASFRAQPDPAPQLAAPAGTAVSAAATRTVPAPAPPASPEPAAVAPSPAPGDKAGVAGPSQVTAGAKQVGQGVMETAKGVGRTVVQGADVAHDGLKAFGLKVRDLFKGVGQAWTNVFGS